MHDKRYHTVRSPTDGDVRRLDLDRRGRNNGTSWIEGADGRPDDNHGVAARYRQNSPAGDETAMVVAKETSFTSEEKEREEDEEAAEDEREGEEEVNTDDEDDDEEDHCQRPASRPNEEEMATSRRPS
jgi:hypothetical protein